MSSLPSGGKMGEDGENPIAGYTLVLNPAALDAGLGCLEMVTQQ